MYYIIAFAIIVAVLINYPGSAIWLKRQRLSLRRVEQKLDALLQHQGIAIPALLSPEVQRLALDQGQRIAAIKLHREETGLGLAEAMAEVDAFQKGALNHPAESKA